MPQPARQPCFLPLTVAAARAAAVAPAGHDVEGPPDPARLVRRHAERADAAAAECWAALLADCDSPGRAALAGQLRTLADVASAYSGRAWLGSAQGARATTATARIDRAVRRGDGEQFAEAFVGFDQAVATAVAGVRPPGEPRP